MCFSAEASYTAAAALTLIGAGCVRKCKQPRQLLIALIPIIFALQQLMEGILWTSTNEIQDFINYAPFAKTVFLSIAFFVWPIWIPLSLWAIEKERWRNWVLAIFLVAGCAYVASLIYQLIVVHRWEGVSVGVIRHSIRYDLPIEFSYLQALVYFAITVLPPLFSSWKYMWVLGLINFIGLLIALYLFSITFISVWCFIAALVSIGVYFVIRKNNSN